MGHLHRIVDVADDIGDPRQTVQSPYRFSESASGITSESRPPKRGEHNVPALCDWLDMDADKVAGLLEDGILLQE